MTFLQSPLLGSCIAPEKSNWNDPLNPTLEEVPYPVVELYTKSYSAMTDELTISQTAISDREKSLNI